MHLEFHCLIPFHGFPKTPPHKTAFFCLHYFSKTKCKSTKKLWNNIFHFKTSQSAKNQLKPAKTENRPKKWYTPFWHKILQLKVTLHYLTTTDLEQLRTFKVFGRHSGKRSRIHTAHMRNSRLKYQGGWELIASPTGSNKKMSLELTELFEGVANNKSKTRQDVKTLV